MIKCQKCGAQYEITEYKSPMRDKDSIKCNHCQEEILSWNGGRFYSAEEISGPTSL